MAARKTDVKYETDVKPELSKVTAWAEGGLTDNDIAHNLGIGRSTFYAWKKEHIDFSNALKTGKEVADQIVENKLYQRACGYEYDEVVFEKVDNKVNLEMADDKLITTDTYKKKITRKFIPPDVTAQIFWLKNRRSDLWRDKQDISIQGELTIRKWEDIITEAKRDD